MGIKTYRSRSTCLTTDDDREFELKHAWGVDIGEYTVKELPDGRAIVGYLSHDDDCRNPIENCDGMGTIYNKDDRDQRCDFHEAVGIDEYGYRHNKPNPLAVVLDLISQSYSIYRVWGLATALPDEEVERSNAVWVPEKYCLEHIQYTAYSQFLPPGVTVEYKSVLNKDGTAKLLPDGQPDPKYFNRITYTLPNGHSRGGYKSFLKAYHAAGKKLGVKFSIKDMRSKMQDVALVCARQAIEEVNKWLEGDCWGVCVEVFDKNNDVIEEEDEACWGYIGAKYAEETLAEEIERKYQWLTVGSIAHKAKQDAFNAFLSSATPHTKKRRTMRRIFE